MSMSLHGLAASPGVAIGKARLFRNHRLIVAQRSISSRQVDGELRRLDEAVAAARAALDGTRGKIPEDVDAGVLEFIDAHIAILEDNALVEETKRIVKDSLCNAEWALRVNQENWERAFDAIDDPYISARRVDVTQVMDRIMGFLVEPGGHSRAESSLQGHVVIAEEIGADTVASLHSHRVAALATAHGGFTSHAVILAKSLRIPMVVGLRDASLYIKDGETVILDGNEGVLLADPTEGLVKHYRERIRKRKAFIGSLAGLRREPTCTLDLHSIRLMVNAELSEDFSAARRMEADGVGLYRTELLHMNRPDLPSEDDHFRAYAAAVRRLRGAPLTIRTVDIAPDDLAVPLRGVEGVVSNPALGLRAIRLCLRDPEMFRPQLRAALRVSARAPVRIMLPLLTEFGELAQVKALLDSLKGEMDAAGERYDPHLPVGAMIEVPAAAICADLFAEELDFMMIGTNDLMQYALAIDRANEEVSYLYEPLHPAVLRLIRTVIDAGEKHGIPVGMCGELANDPRFVRLLLALGLREFSVSPVNFLEVRQVINCTRLSDLARFRPRLLRAGKTGLLRLLLEQINGLEPALAE